MYLKDEILKPCDKTKTCFSFFECVQISCSFSFIITHLYLFYSEFLWDKPIFIVEYNEPNSQQFPTDLQLYRIKQRILLKWNCWFLVKRAVSCYIMRSLPVNEQVEKRNESFRVLKCTRCEKCRIYRIKNKIRAKIFYL